MTNVIEIETKPIEIDKPIIYYANKDITPEPIAGKIWRWNDVAGWKAIKTNI